MWVFEVRRINILLLLSYGMREDCKSISGGVWICVEVTLLDGEGLEW
jgi:hypothetical protein